MTGREQALPDMQLTEFIERNADCEHWLLNSVAGVSADLSSQLEPAADQRA